MKKTKIIAFIAALTVMGAAFTACSSTNDSEETTTLAETTVSEETSAVSEEGADEIIEDVVSDTEDGADDPNEVSDEDIIEDETAEDASMVAFEDENNPLKPVIEAAVSVGEWPYLMEVTDETIISDYFLIDKNDASYEQTIFMQCPMSANMTEIIIIKSTDVDSAKTALEGRQKKAQDTDAFYPDDVERAGASIVGESGDYAYFIMSSNPTEAEAAIIEALAAL